MIDINECKRCKFLAIPISFQGVRQGKAIFKESDDTNVYSCCHTSFNGGVHLLSMGFCPKLNWVNTLNKK